MKSTERVFNASCISIKNGDILFMGNHPANALSRLRDCLKSRGLDVDIISSGSMSTDDMLVITPFLNPCHKTTK